MDVDQIEIVVGPLPIPVVVGMDTVTVVGWQTSQMETLVEHSVL